MLFFINEGVLFLFFFNMGMHLQVISHKWKLLLNLVDTEPGGTLFS